LLGDVLRDAGIQLDHESRDPSINPWIRPDIVDSPLTETGIQQCSARRAQASLLNPQVMIVSPLLRAIQTAKLSFADHHQVPWIAHEGCREDLGLLACNKRRPLSTIKADYPDLDTSLMIDEEDVMWDPNDREMAAAKSDRVYDFLVNFISKRPEEELAVVGHSAWLFHMCNAIVDCGDDDDLASWFLTSEIRSMRLSFSQESEI
jgi:broad specificity phosphatase PhoE